MTVTAPTTRALADFLAANRMPGQRSMNAISLLRRERGRRNTPAPTPRPLAARASEWLLGRVVAEVERRGGETQIEGLYSTECLEVVDKQDGMVLAHAEGWRAYGRQRARRVSLSYLWGRDDAGSGPWAVRVAGNVTTVAEALEWLTPAAVKQAMARGLRVRRQGDVYAVETNQVHDGRGVDALPESHVWRPDTRHLVHRPEDRRRHRPLRLPYPVRFVPQTAYAMGRSGGRVDAD